MGTLSGERKKAQPDPRPTGGRLPRRTPLPSPVIPAGFRRGRPLSSSYLFFLGAGGRQQVGNISRSKEFGERLHLQRKR